MTRTTPDGVFAEAARAELLHRVRVGGAGRPARRPFVVEAFVAVAVVVAVVAVVLGVHQVRGVPDREAPAASQPLPSATTSAAPTPSPTATTSAPAAVPLIGPPGAKVRTEAQIRAWGATHNPTASRTDEDVLVTACMARKGFLYDPIFEVTSDGRPGYSGMSAAHEAAFTLALDGPRQTGVYDWRAAGCWGRAVHETGNDSSH